MENRNLVPPEGGWGWVVVVGASAVNICTRSIELSFGLLFGDILRDLGVETTGAAVIMSTLDALNNFSGIFVGPLIKSFTYRKVSLIGSLLVALGLILTSWAGSMTHLIVTYSIINGLGVGLTGSATFVALNEYFVKKRGQAVGFSLAGTALGMMLMPQAIRVLLEEYGFRGAVLLLGGFALNSLVGSALLQPAKWHFVPVVANTKQSQNKKTMEPIPEDKEEHEEEHKEVDDLISHHMMVKTFEELRAGPQNGKSTFRRNSSTTNFQGKRLPLRRASKDSIMNSFSRLDFTGSSIQLALDVEEVASVSDQPTRSRKRRNQNYPGVTLDHEELEEFQQEKNADIHPATFWRKVVAFMDFDLLQDPIYLNLVFGISIFYVAEQNFKMVMPFFFHSIGYTKSDVASFLSVQACADIVARLVLPPIYDRLNVSKRSLFMMGIFFLGISRSILAQQTSYLSIMIWLSIAGFVRGAALINSSITISEYVTFEKLPAAFGLHNVGKGIMVVIVGPLLGKIRDSTRSYPICVHSQTLFIMTCFVVWSIEYGVRYCRSRSKESKNQTAKTDIDT